MRHISILAALAAAIVVLVSCSSPSTKTKEKTDKGLQVTVAQGVLEGIDLSGVKAFLGVPFAQPPVGDLRWKAPQPSVSWEGVRDAKKFGPDPMQAYIYDDMVFRGDGISEDCLYLNVWTPSRTFDEKLPVLIYFNGGGLLAGSGSEFRYAGESMARRGIISITANYREGMFGYFSHPDLTAESGGKGSGNYGFMDQAAAIKWVKDNVAAFGGDPERITIAGESAGSMSVSVLLASPMSKGLFAQAIGSSGAMFPGRVGKGSIWTLKEAEEAGVKVAESLGCKTLEQLRALPDTTILNKTGWNYRTMSAVCVDGVFLKEQPYETYMKGEQADVPLLVGRNSMEAPVTDILRGEKPTVSSLKDAMARVYGSANTDKLLELYGITTDEDVCGASGASVSSDIFIAFSTWLWCELQKTTGTKPVWFYQYNHPRPATRAEAAAGILGIETPVEKPEYEVFKGARHSIDIEYAMGNLSTNLVYDWQPEDYTMSSIFQGYYLNFIKTGNPNGLGLAWWNPVNGSDITPTLQLDVQSRMTEDSQFYRKNQFIRDFWFPEK